ncbi:MAG: tetraacyldisaccharide 4'-kinase, partial [Deltaproteobacteria bacterium]|nr:tetraacyldisaccharide 4'-kinase [Deltaproteobacteria bacterium]
MGIIPDCIICNSEMRKLLSNLYGAVVGIRNVLYNHGILLSYLTPPVVVSIGNIEVGGTGKTPFTITLAQHLQKRGH